MKSFDEIKADVMIDIPHHPKLETIKKGLFEHYWFRKNKKFYCSHCGNEYEDDWNECPNCHTRGTNRLITSRTNFDNFTKEYRVNVLQVYKGRIALRQYSIIQRIINLVESIEIEEIERSVVYNGDFQTLYKLNKDHKYHWNSSNTDPWCFGRLNENNRVRRPIKYFNIEPESYEEVLKETEVKYTMVGKFIDELEDNGIHYSFRYIHAAAIYPWVEYVYKVGGLKLYKDILNFSADMRVVKKQNIKKYIKFIKEKNPNAVQFYMRSMSDKSNSKLSDQYILSQEGRSENVLPMFRKMNQLCQMTGFSYEKINNYIESRKSECSRGTSLTIDEYYDYLNMMINLKCPPTTELLAFPKDFVKAHDDAVKKFNALKLETKNKEYKKRLSKLLKLEYSSNGLSIVVPRALDQIVQEGKSLGHCVGSYVERVQEGKTIILFIRNTNKIDKPFYTLEYKNKFVVQCRGFRNKNTTPEINQFIDEWLKWVNNPKQRKVRMQPSNQMVMQG